MKLERSVEEMGRLSRLVTRSEKRIKLNERRGFTSDLAGRMILVCDSGEDSSLEKSEPSVHTAGFAMSLPRGLVRVVLFLLPARSQRWGL